MKFKFTCLALGLVLFSGHQAYGKPVEDLFLSLNSKHLKIFSVEESKNYESKTHVLQEIGLTWKPQTEVFSDSQECSLEMFRQALQEGPQPEAVLQKYWFQCESRWRLNPHSGFTQSQEILRTGFEPLHHPAVRMVEWSLPNQIKLRGFLFLKGPRVRPLIIIRPGIFSDIRSTVAERFLMMQLFEEGPYHLLVLPSSSGADYIRDNHNLAFGGFDEGLQTNYILQYLERTDEPLRKLINKIHLVGISLGGHGLWLTHLLQQNHPESLIDKTLLLCPAVNLKETEAFQEKKFLHRLFIQFWFWWRLNKNKSYLQINPQTPIGSYLESFFNSYQEPSLPWNYPQFPLPGNPTPYWAWNDFWSWLPKYNFEKTFVLWTKNDPVVPPEANAHRLRKQILAPKEALLELPRGLHCSLSTSYQWPAISLSLRGYLDPQALNETTSWQQRFPIRAKIKSVQIKHLELAGDMLQLTLFVKFSQPWRPPLTMVLHVPKGLSDQTWVLDSPNETLLESLKRELTSKFSWHQNMNNEWTLFFKTSQTDNHGHQ